MKYLYAILILICAIAVWAFGEPPVPPTTDDAPVSTNFVGEIGEAPAVPDYTPTNSVIVLAPEYEWELTFEWQPSLTSNVGRVTYPIKVQVPFEHDQGFVFVRAKKVRK